MSEFFISGFEGCDPQPSFLPSALGVRREKLLHHAHVELMKFEFGTLDMHNGKDTCAAQSLVRANARSGRLSHGRAKQRAKSYVAKAGSEHCPSCWVYEGTKRPLTFTHGERLDTACCAVCSGQFQLPRV